MKNGHKYDGNATWRLYDFKIQYIFRDPMCDRKALICRAFKHGQPVRDMIIRIGDQAVSDCGAGTFRNDPARPKAGWIVDRGAKYAQNRDNKSRYPPDENLFFVFFMNDIINLFQIYIICAGLLYLHIY